MKVLLDEWLPRKLKNYLQGHECSTVPEAGWTGKKNGELLVLAEKNGYEIFLILDRGMEYEQNLEGREIAIILVSARSNRLADLLPRTQDILTVLGSTRVGQLVRVGG